jgi:tetratricopeptide (TPR) repeat protein
MVKRAYATVGACIVWLALATAPAQQPQKPPEDPLLKQVEETSKRCQVESNKFREDGGKPGDPRDPALKWAEVLWKYREEYPGTPAAARATAAALTWLRHADQDKEVLARAEKLPLDDPAWDRVIAGVSLSAKKTGEYDRFLRIAESLLSRSKDGKLRAIVYSTMGRSWLDRDRPQEAKAAFESAIRESPGSDTAKAAERSIYEITTLAIGKPAPQFAARTIDGRPISLADFRGKVVLLNVWATW